MDSSLYKSPEHYLNLQDMMRPKDKRLTMEESLQKCSDALTKYSGEIFTNDFYKTFEGYLLSRSKFKYVTLRCKKMSRSKEMEFRTSNK